MSLGAFSFEFWLSSPACKEEDPLPGLPGAQTNSSLPEGERMVGGRQPYCHFTRDQLSEVFRRHSLFNSVQRQKQNRSCSPGVRQVRGDGPKGEGARKGGRVSVNPSPLLENSSKDMPWCPGTPSILSGKGNEEETETKPLDSFAYGQV